MTVSPKTPFVTEIYSTTGETYHMWMSQVPGQEPRIFASYEAAEEWTQLLLEAEQRVNNDDN